MNWFVLEIEDGRPEIFVSKMSREDKVLEAYVQGKGIRLSGPIKYTDKAESTLATGKKIAVYTAHAVVI